MILLLLYACSGEKVPAPAVPGIELGEVVVCADPGARAGSPFEVVELPDQIVAAEPSDAGQYDGAGVSVEDYDGDGRLDLFLPNTGLDQLYLGSADGLVNADDHLPERALEADRSTGTATADVDGDGQPDLLIADQGGAPQIWLNQGGVFEESDAGLGDEGLHGAGGAFDDFDGDGDLDLFLINHYEGGELADGMLTGNMPPGHPDRLFVNEGNGHFADESSRLPAELLGESFTLAGGWYDVDGDGARELYVVNDFGSLAAPNRMLKYDGERFVVMDASLGLDVRVYGMGLGVGDLNGDTVPDFAVTSWDQLVLLLSGGGAWYESSLALGFVPEGDDRHVAWGVVFADLDNDGDLDAPVNFGQLQMPEDVAEQFEAELALGNPREQRDALYIQGEDGSFVESAEAWGVADPGLSRGVLAVDLNRDGWLDLVKRDVAGPTLVYQARCGSEAWLEVDFSVPAVGARVEVSLGGKSWTRWVVAGSESFASGGPMEAHFGLGNLPPDSDPRVDLRVTWPDGTTSQWEGIGVNRRVTVGG